MLKLFNGDGSYHDLDPRKALLQRITTDPEIFGGKTVIRGRHLSIEHVLGNLAAGESPQAVLDACPFLEPDGIRACLIHAERVVIERDRTGISCRASPLT